MGTYPDWFDGDPFTTETEYARICANVGDGRHASTMVAKDTGRQGPSIVVVGGVHGGEPAGAYAAEEIAQWTPDCGRLAVIPRANPAGLRNRQRDNTYGNDLNDAFPESAQLDEMIPHARAIWGAIDAQRPDVVIDMHTSRWPRSMSGKSASNGQAIYPDDEDMELAERVCDRVSDEHIRHGDNLLSDEWQSKRGKYYFQTGNPQGEGGDVALIDRVIYQLGISGYLVEVARNGVSFEARVLWHTAVVKELAEEHGMAFL